MYKEPIRVSIYIMIELQHAPRIVKRRVNSVIFRYILNSSYYMEEMVCDITAALNINAVDEVERIVGRQNGYIIPLILK